MKGVNFNSNKGITLVALIITIIVMLILVGVTINVALNGGLFQNAKKARDDTQKQMEKEELMTLATGRFDIKTDKVDSDKLIEDIGKTGNYKDVSVQGAKVIATGIKSGTVWQIDLGSAEVKEYEESANPWIGRGLTSPNVVFDTPYKLEGEEQNTITLYSDGRFWASWDEQPISSSDVDAGIETGAFAIPANNQITAENVIRFIFEDDATYGKIIRAQGLESHDLIFYINKPEPQDPVAGKTFLNPAANEAGLVEAYGRNQFTVEFAESGQTFELRTIANENNASVPADYTGTYTFEGNTIYLTVNEEPYSAYINNMEAEVFSIMNGNQVVNQYFYLGGVTGGTILATNMTAGMAPFSGTYANGSDTITFSTDSDGNGIYNQSYDIIYNYDAQNERLNIWAGGAPSNVSCVLLNNESGNSYSLANWNGSMMRIGNTVYTKQQ